MINFGDNVKWLSLLIPTTWTEDLGAARRVSLYRFEPSFSSKNADYRQYNISCEVRMPNGSVVTEKSGAVYYRTDYLTAKTMMKNKIREQIRKKYPHV